MQNGSSRPVDGEGQGAGVVTPGSQQIDIFAAGNRTLLAVFAHPDDEVVIGPLLARYAREGVKVHLAIATNGSKGIREHADIPAGHALAQARGEEAVRACKRLHIQPPILLDLEDGAGDTGSRWGDPLPALVRLREEVVRLFVELRPEIVITFGPEGMTGHPDHRLVSNVVTEVFQAGGDGWPRQLYYTGVDRDKLQTVPLPHESVVESLRKLLLTLALESRHLPVRVPYREEDFETARAAFACYKSQFTEKEMAELMALTGHLFSGGVPLRSWCSALVCKGF